MEGVGTNSSGEGDGDHPNRHQHVCQLLVSVGLVGNHMTEALAVDALELFPTDRTLTQQRLDVFLHLVGHWDQLPVEAITNGSTDVVDSRRGSPTLLVLFVRLHSDGCRLQLIGECAQEFLEHRWVVHDDMCDLRMLERRDPDRVLCRIELPQLPNEIPIDVGRRSKQTVQMDLVRCLRQRLFKALLMEGI
tara:strand:+ start:2600 stop:3172 length:573 start_codon:yes stop_codon:yes gene_type:complete